MSLNLTTFLYSRKKVWFFNFLVSSWQSNLVCKDQEVQNSSKRNINQVVSCTIVLFLESDDFPLLFLSTSEARCAGIYFFYRGKSKELLTGRSTDVLHSSKGGLISESLSFCLKSPKKVPNHKLSNFQKILVVVIWHLFLEIWANCPVNLHPLF